MGFITLITLVLAVSLVLPLVRVVLGPTVYDRMLGVGIIGTKTVILICLGGFLYQRADMFVDIALAYAMLNFIFSVVVAKYLDHTEGARS